jgi:hypothetical protein
VLDRFVGARGASGNDQPLSPHRRG